MEGWKEGKANLPTAPGNKVGLPRVDCTRGFGFWMTDTTWPWMIFQLIFLVLWSLSSSV